MRATLRVGTGFDVHRLEPGRPCILGGVTLDHPSGPAGHSDGDAVLHAIIDALTGAAGLDDVGSLFPDTSSEWKDADSAALLTQVMGLVREAGWTVGNVDAVIATEGPRISPYRQAICRRIAKLLDVSEDCVNVKGKTVEGLGALADGRGVAVQAVCLLQRGI